MNLVVKIKQFSSSSQRCVLFDIFGWKSWIFGTVKNIDKEHLLKHYSKPVLKDVEYIAIDEFAYQKGHNYQTVVYDLVAGRAIFVGLQVRGKPG